ncbi:MAG: 50S ribosomal protein L16 [Nitrososphaerota archaeon]|nr:50S ribosomal protein L16 [Nitrososphaerota archaeon]
MHGKNYRFTSGMPLTSKVYSPGAPNSKIARFSTGQASPDYDYILRLISTEKVQIRHNALEAARVAANKKLTPIGETAYFLRVIVYPHVILRENRMIATAGADRLQEGMRKAWGKPMGLAARVMPGSSILELHIKKENLAKAREAMKSASAKLPMPTEIEIVPLTKSAPEIAASK